MNINDQVKYKKLGYNTYGVIRDIRDDLIYVETYGETAWYHKDLWEVIPNPKYTVFTLKYTGEVEKMLDRVERQGYSQGYDDAKNGFPSRY